MHNMNFIILLLSLLLNVVNAQTDREFWFVAPEVTYDHNVPGGMPVFFSFTTTDLDAYVTLDMPANPAWIDTTIYVPPNSNVRWNSTHRLNLLETQWNEGTKGINNNGIYITSTNLITCYYECSNYNNPDIWSLKGENALGKEFYLTFQTHLYNNNRNYRENNNGWNVPAYSSADIVVTDDDTYITIELPADKGLYWGLSGAYFIDTTIVIGPLSRGQTFTAIPAHLNDMPVLPPGEAWKETDQIFKRGRAGVDHLAGVRVTSNNDIAISLKDDSMKSMVGGCYDLAGDQTIPTRILGYEYIAMKGQLSEGWKNNDQQYSGGNPIGNWYGLPDEWIVQERLYITAVNNNTPIAINSIPQDTIDEGETFMWEVVDNITLIESDAAHPVYVLQMSGWGCEIGEAVLPATSVCTGSGQVGFTRSIYKDPADRINRLYLNIMVQKYAKGYFRFNGVPQGAGDLLDPVNFIDIPNSDWAAARIGPIDSATIPPYVQTMVSNDSDVFHLGVINGYSSGGTRFGYFSDYNELDVSSYIVGSGSSGIRLCHGDSAQIVANGGFFYKWDPEDYLSDPYDPLPMCTTPDDRTYVASVRGACRAQKSTTVKVFVSTPCEARFSIDTAHMCAPHTITIHDNSLGVSKFYWDFKYNGPGDEIIWNFNPDTINSDTTFYYTYQNQTDTIQRWQIRLKIENPDQCWDSMSHWVTVYPEPMVDFSVSDSVGCHPLVVNYTNESLNTSYYKWDFGDDGSSLDTNATHSFWNTTNRDTMFTTRLTGFEIYPQGICRDTTYYDSITIHPYVEAGFTVDPVLACAPHTAIFSPVVINADSLSWNFEIDSVTVGSDTNQTVGPYLNTTNNPTYSIITLEAWNNDGGKLCGDTWDDTLTLIPSVDADFTMSRDVVCDSDSIPIIFNNTSTGYNLTYMWDFGGTGSDTATNPWRYFENKTSASVVYPIELTATSQAWIYCYDDQTYNLTVHPYIKADFDISDALITCHPFEATLTNLTNRGSTYRWTSPPSSPTFDSTVFNKNPFIYDFTNSDTVIIVDTIKLLSINAEGCRDSAQKTVTVYPEVYAIISPDTSGCHPLDVTFTNSSWPTSQIVYYSWDFDDGETSSDGSSTVSHTFENYTSADLDRIVTLEVENAQGCVHDTSVTVTIHPRLEASFYFIDTNKCSPRVLTLYSDSEGTIDGGGYEWDYDGNGTPDESGPQNVTNTFTNTGTSDVTYDVTLTVQNTGGLCTSSYTLPVLVYPEVLANFSTDPGLEGCNPFTATFTNTSNPVAQYFYWDFDDNTFDTIETPAPHTFEHGNDNDIVFYVELTALASNLLCEDDTVIPITSYAHIKPSIKIDDPTVCHNVPLIIYNQSIGGIVLNSWDFGDDESNFNSDPSFTYTYQDTTEAPLNYTIKLKVYNSHGCGDSTTHDVTIYPQVRASFDSILPACHPYQVTINNTTNSLGGSNLYEWYFGDGGTSIDSVPTHTYTNPTYADKDYTVRLYATSQYECEDSTQQTFTLYHVPLAKFNVDSNIACHPFPVNFTNQSQTSGSTFYWDFDDNAGGAQYDTTYTTADTRSHTYPNTGNDIASYTIQMDAVTSYGCSDFDTLTIKVYPQVIALFSDLDSAGCSPFRYEPINNSENAERYYWQFLGGSTPLTSSIFDPKQILTNTTSQDLQYTVILRSYSEAGCSDLDTHYVTVFPQPVAEFDASPYFNTWVPDITVNFTNLSNFLDVFQYAWDFDDGTPIEINSAANFQHEYEVWSPNSSSTFTINLIGTNTQHPECADTATEVIYMFPPEPVVETSTSTDDICQPGYITFTINPEYYDNNVAEPFLWNFDDGSEPYGTSSTSVTWYFDEPKIYKVQVTIVGYGSNNVFSTHREITVHPKPFADFSIIPEVVKLPEAIIRCFNYSEEANFYHWYFGDGDTSNLYEPTHEYKITSNAQLEDLQATDTVNFSVNLIVETLYGCLDTAEYQTVSVIGQGYLELPTVFDPSSNDEDYKTFKPYLRNEGAGIADYEIWIYNRWGELVYHSDVHPLEEGSGWNGKVMNTGAECPMDVYVYKLRAKFVNGESHFDVGDVTLLR